MTSAEALDFLRSHQPMPEDSAADENLRGTYVDVLTHFLENPDPRAVPLLVNSIPADSSLEMYDSVGFALMEYPLEYVVPSLRDGILPGSPSLQRRCCRWAASLGAWELEPLVRYVAGGDDPEVRAAAESFLTAFASRPETSESPT
jgi:hypothetical protein